MDLFTMEILLPVLAMVGAAIFIALKNNAQKALEKQPELLKRLADTAVKSAQDKMKTEEGQQKRAMAIRTLVRMANGIGLKINEDWVEDLIREAYVNMKNQETPVVVANEATVVENAECEEITTETSRPAYSRHGVQHVEK